MPNVHHLWMQCIEQMPLPLHQYLSSLAPGHLASTE